MAGGSVGILVKEAVYGTIVGLVFGVGWLFTVTKPTERMISGYYKKVTFLGLVYSSALTSFSSLAVNGVACGRNAGGDVALHLKAGRQRQQGGRRGISSAEWWNR